jgi:pimeloyl-ACP methyl ester carboxylesterase
MALPGSTALFRYKNLHKIYRLYLEWSPDWPMDFGHIQAVKECLSANNCLSVALSYYRSSMLRGSTDSALRELLQTQIQVPTLSIAGANDGCIGIQCFENQAQGFANDFSFHRIEGAGHFCHFEKPEEFNQQMMEFLQGSVSLDKALQETQDQA